MFSAVPRKADPLLHRNRQQFDVGNGLAVLFWTSSRSSGRRSRRPATIANSPPPKFPSGPRGCRIAFLPGHSFGTRGPLTRVPPRQSAVGSRQSNRRDRINSLCRYCGERPKAGRRRRILGLRGRYRFRCPRRNKENQFNKKHLMFGASILPERIGTSRRKTIESPGIANVQPNC